MKRISVILLLALLVFATGASAYRPPVTGDVFLKGAVGYDVRAYNAQGNGSTDDSMVCRYDGTDWWCTVGGLSVGTGNLFGSSFAGSDIVLGVENFAAQINALDAITTGYGNISLGAYYLTDTSYGVVLIDWAEEFRMACSPYGGSIQLDDQQLETFLREQIEALDRIRGNLMSLIIRLQDGEVSIPR